MALDAGTTIGPYEVTGLIGQGGMGEVYQARDTPFSREIYSMRRTHDELE